MISITVDEKKKIREAYPNVHIVRTMKQRSKRHRYYMAEESGPMRMLRKLRGEVEERKDRRPSRRTGNRGRS